MNYQIFRTSFLAIVASSVVAFTAHAQAPSGKPTVSGKFLGNGKDGKIQHLIVQPCDPFSGKPAVQLVFTEKNPAASKDPDFDAGFKKLGSALVISTFKDGGVFGCEVVHSAHQKSPFSSVGRVKITDIKVTDTHISGLLDSGGEQEFFGEKWDVALTFSAPLPKGAFAAVAPAPTPKKEELEKPAAPDKPMLPVAKVPLPAGALDVNYNATVEHITFRSDSAVSTVSKDVIAKLKAAGWKDVPGSLNGKLNAILKRKLDAAELTIVIQPAGKGCTAKVFTQGLDWTEAPASAPAKPAAEPDVKSIEAEANRQIQDALKNIPKF